MRSFEQITSLVMSAIRDKVGECSYSYCVAMFPTYVVFYYDGKLYQADYSVAEDSDDVTLGETTEVKEEVAYVPVPEGPGFTFSEMVAGQDFVIYRGPVFQAGNYPDKG